jgi:hypothetical protein
MNTSPTLGGTGAPEAGSRRVTVATYPDYGSAQRAVDHLSDNRFPVDRTTIVGMDLRMVERVLGRLTTTRAALTGATGGAWFGLLIGLLFGIFAVDGWLVVVLAGVLVGAAGGAIFRAIAHALTGGRRDFASRSSIEATHYAVTVEADRAEEAGRLLARLPATPGR